MMSFIALSLLLTIISRCASASPSFLRSSRSKRTQRSGHGHVVCHCHEIPVSSSPLSHVGTCNSNLVSTLFRGAFLRVASDLTGGTVFENIKTRSALSTSTPCNTSPLGIAKSIVHENGWRGLWKGTPSRMVEGSLVGAVFLATSTVVKRQLLQRHIVARPTTASLLAGLVGGVAQAVVMTPTSLVFTAVNDSPAKDTSSITVARTILKEKGFCGFYAAGGKALIIRQATNWASRAGLTEVARRYMGGYGLVGELGAGVIGGVGSCWNTPIETMRVLAQSDVNKGMAAKPIPVYWKETIEKDGYQGLFRGFTPRAFQAVWQTTFLIVVPNLMGM